MACASRGETPNRSASNPAASGRKAPRRAKSGASRRSQPRSAGKSPTRSRPWDSSSQNSSGVAAPGNRQPIATMATGSSGAGAAGGAGVTVAEAAVSAPPVSSARSQAARAAGVGWSKIRPAGSGSPVAARSALRSSMAVSESKPRSRNALSGATVAAVPWPSTKAARLRTSSSEIRRRSPSPAAARRAARPSAPAASSAPSGVSVGASSRSSGLGRAAVKPAANRVQSTSATTTAAAVPSPSATVPPSIRLRTVTARSGGRGVSPERRSRWVRASSSAMPDSAHGPQPMDVAGSPWARRRSARASRWALAAA